MRDWAKGRVRMATVFDASKVVLHDFIDERVATSAGVITDEHACYRGISNPHWTVNHSWKELVRKSDHTKGVESFRATLKRGIEGVYHRMSVAHRDRYVQEFAARTNSRPLDTIDHMRIFACRLANRR